MGIFSSNYSSPLGEILIFARGEVVIGLFFEGQKLPTWTFGAKEGDSPIFSRVKSFLTAYFSGENKAFDFPFRITGSPFQQAVLFEVLKIPYGKTLTYGEITKTLEKTFSRRLSAQSVGGAIGRNPLLILIPCHRVAGKGNKLTGFAAGLDKKRFLLQLEGVDLSVFKF